MEEKETVMVTMVAKTSSNQQKNLDPIQEEEMEMTVDCVDHAQVSSPQPWIDSVKTSSPQPSPQIDSAKAYPSIDSVTLYLVQPLKDSVNAYQRFGSLQKKAPWNGCVKAQKPQAWKNSA